MRVFVSGATRGCGRSIALALRAEGHDVVALVDNAWQGEALPELAGCEMYVGTPLNPVALDGTLSGCDWVVQADLRGVWAADASAPQWNVAGTLNLLSVAIKNGVRRALVVSPWTGGMAARCADSEALIASWRRVEGLEAELGGRLTVRAVRCGQIMGPGPFEATLGLGRLMRGRVPGGAWEGECYGVDGWGLGRLLVQEMGGSVITGRLTAACHLGSMDEVRRRLCVGRSGVRWIMGVTETNALTDWLRHGETVDRGSDPDQQRTLERTVQWIRGTFQAEER